MTSLACLPYWLALPALLLVSLQLGCGSDAGCVDEDLDGFGEGCELGPDCDDRNAARNTDCETVPPPDCSADPFSTGCPCLRGASTPCFPGPPESAGVGLCEEGITSCVNLRWGLCAGSRLPTFEICDDRDQDCDGRVDEGVSSPCGDCEPTCTGAVWGGDDLPFDEPALSSSSNLAVTDDGDLTLAFVPQPASDFVWVPNSADGTLSKIDPTTATEVARYAVGIEPSRVAVDYDGHAWVANRAFDDIPTVVKVAAASGSCVDRNGNSLIDTSSGPTDVMPEGTDECVLFTTAVGPAGSVARALAIDGTRDQGFGGKAWVGLYERQELVVIHGDSGVVLDRIALDDTGVEFKPYGAHFDRFGTLWLSSQDGYLLRLDQTATARRLVRVEVPYPCFLVYSLGVHENGNLFLSGHHCDQVLRYNPVRGLWNRLGTEPSTRGVTVEGDDVFVSHTGGLLSRISASPLTVEEVVDLHSLGQQPLDSIGLSVDATGAVWIASGQGGSGGSGVVTRVEGGAVTAQVPVGKTPHTQGDLTGSQLLGGFAPEGQLDRVFSGCAGGVSTRWERVHLSAMPGSSGAVQVEARHGATEAELASAAFEIVGRFPDAAPPFELAFPAGGQLELRVVLSTDARDGAPRVEQVGLEWDCPGPI